MKDPNRQVQSSSRNRAQASRTLRPQEEKLHRIAQNHEHLNDGCRIVRTFIEGEAISDAVRVHKNPKNTKQEV